MPLLSVSRKLRRATARFVHLPVVIPSEARNLPHGDEITQA
jgi:hypothetical protein